MARMTRRACTMHDVRRQVTHFSRHMYNHLRVTSMRRRRCWQLAVVPALVASLAIASSAAAHDFWLIPDLFSVSADSNVHVNGRSCLRFPHGAAVQPARIAAARIIGAASDTKITEMAVEGTSLRLHAKPAVSGQYLIAVALTPRTTRSTPMGLLRYLRAEGGAAEAARLERENAFAGMDSVVYGGASYAFTVVQVGRAGPRAFSKTAGFPLEFVPVNDPTHVHLGDTLHVKVLGAGKVVPGITIDAVPASDSTDAATAAAPSLVADASGVVHVPLTKAGPWVIRSAFVVRRNGTAKEMDVARSTYVFNVGTKH